MLNNVELFVQQSTTMTKRHMSQKLGFLEPKITKKCQFNNIGSGFGFYKN